MKLILEGTIPGKVLQTDSQRAKNGGLDPSWLNLAFLGPILSPEAPNRRVPSCAVKTCAVRPVFASVVGELRAANPSKCARAHEAKCYPRGTT